MGSLIKYISCHLSSCKISNEDLAISFPKYTSDEIYKKIGVKTRYNTTDNVIGSDLAFLAAEDLFRQNKLKKEDVQFLLFCTEGLDYIAPMTACIL